jgi:uncharacterized protein (TIGR03118 family)
MPVLKRAAVLCSVAIVAASMASVSAAHADDPGANAYHVTRLVADQPGVAMHTDPHLINAWGLVAGPATPWWVADNETDVSTLYDGAGNMIPLVVSVAGAPTGTVFNGGPGFVVSHGGFSGPSIFLFATEAGKIRGWNPGVTPPSPSTKAFFVAGRAWAGAVYKGLAIATASEGPLLYATDFHNGRVDVFNDTFQRVHRKAFVDPNIPDSFAPFGIQALGGNVFVTYAKRDPATNDDVPGRGLGFVDMFDPEGHLLGRVASRHALNAPWGLAWAPDGFGAFSGDLLVGNFGDGRIHAFEPQANGSFERAGVLRRADGHAVHIDGLWAIEFGNGGAAGPMTSLFFTAGPDDEQHGLFGRIDVNAST